MKTTLKGFREYLNGSALAALITPVKNQLSGSTFEDFANELQNVSNSPCGAAGGFGGFIYYSETVAFWRRNRKKITRYMEELAESLGEKNALTMVCGFNSFKDEDTNDIARALYGNYSDDFTQIYNTFAWFALEEIAYQFDSYKYECEND